MLNGMDHHAVAALNVRHGVAHGLDDAHLLVTEDVVTFGAIHRGPNVARGGAAVVGGGT
jgi:hypothetical protein